MPPTKHCRKCGRDLPADTDHFHRAGAGLRATCKDCTKGSQAAYRAANPSYPRTLAWRQKNWQRTLQHNKDWRQRNPDKQRLIGFRQHLKRQGWTYEAWLAAMEAQQGICAIEGCERPAECADHCHTSGRARKLLCGSCNKALGLIYDNPAVARGLAAYLEAHRADGEGVAVSV